MVGALQLPPIADKIVFFFLENQLQTIYNVF